MASSCASRRTAWRTSRLRTSSVMTIARARPSPGGSTRRPTPRSCSWRWWPGRGARRGTPSRCTCPITGARGGGARSRRGQLVSCSSRDLACGFAWSLTTLRWPMVPAACSTCRRLASPATRASRRGSSSATTCSRRWRRCCGSAWLDGRRSSSGRATADWWRRRPPIRVCWRPRSRFGTRERRRACRSPRRGGTSGFSSRSGLAPTAPARSASSGRPSRSSGPQFTATSAQLHSAWWKAPEPTAASGGTSARRSASRWRRSSATLSCRRW